MLHKYVYALYNAIQVHIFDIPGKDNFLTMSTCSLQCCSIPFIFLFVLVMGGGSASMGEV